MPKTKVEIYPSVVLKIQSLIDRHPGLLSNMTAAVNYVLDASVDAVDKDLIDLPGRMISWHNKNK